MILDMTHQQLIARLERAVKAAGSQTAYGRSLGLTPQYICNVLAGRQLPGTAILDALGVRRIVRRVVSYEEKHSQDAA